MVQGGVGLFLMSEVPLLSGGGGAFSYERGTPVRWQVIEDHLAKLNKAVCLFDPAKLRWTPPTPSSAGPKKAR